MITRTSKVQGSKDHMETGDNRHSNQQSVQPVKRSPRVVASFDSAGSKCERHLVSVFFKSGKVFSDRNWIENQSIRKCPIHHLVWHVWSSITNCPGHPSQTVLVIWCLPFPFQTWSLSVRFTVSWARWDRQRSPSKHGTNFLHTTDRRKQFMIQQTFWIEWNRGMKIFQLKKMQKRSNFFASILTCVRRVTFRFN